MRGDVIELHPAHEEFAVRIEMFGDEVEKLSYIHPLSGTVLQSRENIFIYPAVHYVMPEEAVERAVKSIREELDAFVARRKAEGGAPTDF